MNLANLSPDSLKYYGAITTNIEEAEVFVQNDRFLGIQKNPELSERINQIFLMIKNDQSIVLEEYSKLTNKIDEKIKIHAYDKLPPLMDQRNNLDTRIKKQKEKSDLVLKNFSDLKIALEAKSEKITELDKERMEQFKRQTKKNRKNVFRAIASEVESSIEEEKKERNNLVNETLEKIEGLITKAKKKNNEYPELPIEIIDLISKRDYRVPEFLDYTQLAALLRIDYDNSAYSVGYWHMLKRIYIINIIFDECYSYQKFFRDKNLHIHNQVSASKIFKASEVSVDFFQQAHISMVPQIQLVSNKSPLGQNIVNRVQTFNPKIHLQKYFKWVSDGLVPLNIILNCTDYTANYINQIDDISESNDRETLFTSLNHVIKGDTNVQVKFKFVLAKIFDTLTRLIQQLMSKNRQFSEIITNEEGLTKNYDFYVKKNRLNNVGEAIDGMLDALQGCIESEILVLPLES